MTSWIARSYHAVGLGILAAACAAPQPESAVRRDFVPEYGHLVALPGAATVAVGDSIVFRAVALDSSGDTIQSPSIDWRSANSEIASVTPAGVVVAKAPGLAGISAQGGGRVAAARVIVVPSGTSIARTRRAPDSAARTSAIAPRPRTSATAAAPRMRSAAASDLAPPPAERPNEPAGYTPITNRNFRSKAKHRDDLGPDGSEGWTGTEARHRRFTIETDPSAPTGDGLVGQMFYSAGHRAGTGPATSNIYFPEGITEAYVSIWAKISPNWVGNQSNTNKMFFMGISGGNNQFFFSAEGSGSRRLEAQLRLQGVGDERGRIRPNVSAAEVVRGEWQHWEFLLKCNSGINMNDGALALWINGAQVTTVSNVNWTQTKHQDRPCAINMFHWNPTYGGGGASPGVDQWIRFDRVYISGR